MRISYLFILGSVETYRASIIEYSPLSGASVPVRVGGVETWAQVKGAGGLATCADR